MTTSDAGADAPVSALTAWERGAYALSALLALSALFVLPVVRAIDPVLAVGLTFEGGAVLHGSIRARYPEQSGGATPYVDPWGRAWRWSQAHLYSVGPDGLDAQGEGDDVTTDELHAHPLRRALPSVVRRSPRGALVTAAVLLAVWTFVTRGTLRARREPWSVEVVRSAWIVSAPAAVGVWWVLDVPFTLDQRAISGELGFVRLPLPLALLLSWGLLCFLPALAWRLSRPGPGA